MNTSPSHPSLGAQVNEGGVHFRVWAPRVQRLELMLEGDERALSMVPAPHGLHELFVEGIGAGTRYRFRPDGQGPFPDPCTRFQPLGVHGPSEVVDPAAFAWTDAGWGGVPLDELVLYELHVGTFTPEGTFRAAQERLPELQALGVTAIELMPVADFPGRWNWGYDGVCLFAPARCYGTPDDLRRLVDHAHHLGLAVLLDAVYNHLGPDGNYLRAFCLDYFTAHHKTPWGDALNFDDEGSGPVRAFFVDCARAWLTEYHLDGLRLDATHAIVDDSPRHILAELASAAHRLPGPRRLLIAEDHRNLATLVKPQAEGGYGLDAVWSDDLHHHLRHRLAGDSDGYYMDFTGTAEDIAQTLRRGWFFCGQFSAYAGHPRGTDPAGIPPERFVVCLQNHDQVGNRALGERLHHQVDLAAYRAALGLLLLAPQTPLLFMGQEWACSSPFLYFTDHHDELGRLVTAGRREEFKRFAAFADPAQREQIPDPQAAATFERSRLDWSERAREPHASVLRLHAALLQCRRSLLAEGDRAAFTARACGPSAVVLDWGTFAAVVQLEGAGEVGLHGVLRGGPWEARLTTEEAAFAPDAQPPEVTLEGPTPRVRFARPGAVLLRRV